MGFLSNLGSSLKSAWDSFTGFIDDVPVLGERTREGARFHGRALDDIGGALGLGELERLGAQWRSDPRQGARELAGTAALIAGAYYAWPYLSGGGASSAVNPYSFSYGTQVGNSGLYGLSASTSANAAAPFASSAVGSGGGLYGLSAGTGTSAGGGLAAFSGTSAGFSGGSAATLGTGGVAQLFAGGAGPGAGYFDRGLSYLSRGASNMGSSRLGRYAIAQGLSGLYGSREQRKLRRRYEDDINNFDVSTQPGFRSGRRSVGRRLAAQGYGNSTNLDAALLDYASQEQDRYAQRRASQYQAQLGDLGSRMNLLNMASLPFIY